MKNPLPDDLYKILACPHCKGSLNYSKDKKSLVCSKCKKSFEIKENIPILMD